MPRGILILFTNYFLRHIWKSWWRRLVYSVRQCKFDNNSFYLSSTKNVQEVFFAVVIRFKYLQNHNRLPRVSHVAIAAETAPPPMNTSKIIIYSQPRNDLVFRPTLLVSASSSCLILISSTLTFPVRRIIENFR